MEKFIKININLENDDAIIEHNFIDNENVILVLKEAIEVLKRSKKEK